MKICRLCGVSKELNEFHKDAKNPDGYCHRCKICKNGRKRAKFTLREKKEAQSMRSFQNTEATLTAQVLDKLLGKNFRIQGNTESPTIFLHVQLDKNTSVEATNFQDLEKQLLALT